MQDLRIEINRLIDQKIGNSQFLSKLLDEKYGEMAATILQKGSDYWIYHKHTVEASDEEKKSPAEKLWLVMRHIQGDKEHSLVPG